MLINFVGQCNISCGALFTDDLKLSVRCVYSDPLPHEQTKLDKNPTSSWPAQICFKLTQSREKKKKKSEADISISSSRADWETVITADTAVVSRGPVATVTATTEGKRPDASWLAVLGLALRR